MAFAQPGPDVLKGLVDYLPQYFGGPLVPGQLFRCPALSSELH